MVPLTSRGFIVSLRESIDSMVTRGASGGEAEKLVVWEYADRAWLRAKEIGARLTSFWRWLRRPNYPMLLKELESIVAEGREATLIVAQWRQRNSAAGRSFTDEELNRLGYLQAAVNSCEGLRAYCESMETGDHMAERGQYLAYFRACQKQGRIFWGKYVYSRLGQ